MSRTYELLSGISDDLEKITYLSKLYGNYVIYIDDYNEACDHVKELCTELGRVNPQEAMKLAAIIGNIFQEEV